MNGKKQGFYAHVTLAVSADGKRVGESGWIPVDRGTLRTGFDRVWAIGDVTGIPLKMGKPLPKAATFAVGEAELVARSVECWVETGDGAAAHGQGDFFGDPAPIVQAVNDACGAAKGSANGVPPRLDAAEGIDGRANQMIEEWRKRSDFARVTEDEVTNSRCVSSLAS